MGFNLLKARTNLVKKKLSGLDTLNSSSSRAHVRRHACFRARCAAQRFSARYNAILFAPGVLSNRLNGT